MGCQAGVSKYLLFIFNAIFALCGLALVIYGVFLKIKFREQVPIGLLVLGCIIFVIGFFRCCGAINENKCKLIMFTIFLTLLLIMQLLLTTVAIVGLKQLALHKVCKNEVLILSKTSNKEQFYDFQRKNKCCGYDGPSDFTTLPSSCCKSEKATCSATDEDFHKRSCKEFCNVVDAFVGFAVVTSLLVIGAVELFGIIFSIHLMCGPKKSSKGQLSKGVCV